MGSMQRARAGAVWGAFRRCARAPRHLKIARRDVSNSSDSQWSCLRPEHIAFRRKHVAIGPIGAPLCRLRRQTASSKRPAKSWRSPLRCQRGVRGPVRAAFVWRSIWGRAVASPIPSASARLAALCRQRKGGHLSRGSRSLVWRAWWARALIMPLQRNSPFVGGERQVNIGASRGDCSR